MYIALNERLRRYNPHTYILPIPQVVYRLL
nr:MAG TPA: hypothetical protein [Caudoviricetes sp.]